MDDDIQELEDRIDDLESEIQQIKKDMVKRAELLAFFVSFIVVFSWGDKIWGFIKNAFFLVIGFFLWLVKS